MSFLYPSFLFGLFAVSIPIIIHLFNFQRPKIIFFPNVKFLKEVEQKNSNRLRLKHLLVLLSRILFIVFLSLMFAQPILNSGTKNTLSGKPIVHIYLDNSLSMQNDIAGERALDVSIKSASKLIDMYPASTEYFLTTNDIETRDMMSKSKDKIQERLTEIKYSNTYKTADLILKRQLQCAKDKTSATHHHFWFSDFQKSTLGDLSKLNFDTVNRYYFVPIRNDEVPNIYIDSLWLQNPLIKPGENNVVEIKLYNGGKKEVKDLVVKLYIDDIQSGTAQVSIGGLSYAKVSFNINLSGSGQKRCVVRFEDHPISFDNEYYFTLDISPRIKILHLYQTQKTPIENVYTNESIFDLESGHIGDFNYSSISTADLIIFNEIEQYPESIVKPMNEFCKKGGDIVIIPSPKTDEASLNALLKSLNVPETKITKSRIDTSKKFQAEMYAPDFNNPFFQSIFEKKDPSMNMPYSYNILTSLNIGWPILKNKSGESFLTSFIVDKSTVYLFASPLQDYYTNFHKHSLCVPVLYKMAFLSITGTEQLAFSLQERGISLMLQNLLPNGICSIEGQGIKLIPQQRYSAGKFTFELPKDDLKPGFYELKCDNKTEKTFALNYGKQESILEFYTMEELKQISEKNKNLTIYQADSSDVFEKKFKEDTLGVPLWKYCLLMCLFFLLAEITLIRML